jgi:hypothetical protein
LEIGAEGEFKLDLRQDCDPGKQKSKDAVRTETYLCHYCQKHPINKVDLCSTMYGKTVGVIKVA